MLLGKLNCIFETFFEIEWERKLTCRNERTPMSLERFSMNNRNVGISKWFFSSICEKTALLYVNIPKTDSMQMHNSEAIEQYVMAQITLERKCAFDRNAKQKFRGKLLELKIHFHVIYPISSLMFFHHLSPENFFITLNFVMTCILQWFFPTIWIIFPWHSFNHI